LEKESRREKVVQTMCTHVSKWYPLKLFQESQCGGEGRWRRVVEEVNSYIDILILWKNRGKCHNVIPSLTTMKEQQKQRNVKGNFSERTISMKISIYITKGKAWQMVPNKAKYKSQSQVWQHTLMYICCSFVWSK
jgi:hypothetical protein